MLAAALFFASSEWPAPSFAQDLAPDMRTLGAVSLPKLPPSYVRTSMDPFTWVYSARTRAEAESLRRPASDAWWRLVGELGGEVRGPIEIRIARNPEEMKKLAPKDAPPPAYASGVAYPDLGLIVLTLSAPETWERPDVQTVLAHELSHIALHQALGGVRVPRWFHEGLAIRHSREATGERTKLLWAAAAGGSLIALDALDLAFSSRPHEVNLAYAEAASFVAFLFARDDGEADLRAAIAHMRAGEPFGGAIWIAYGDSLADLEEAWKDELDTKFRIAPILFSATFVWMLASVLVILAWRRKQRQAREKLRVWEQEEDERKRAEAEVAAAESVEVPVVEVVPTVTHEGQTHTLH